LNNLLQKSVFTAEDLDRIGRELSPQNWLNQHKTPFLGNYDINVVMKALQEMSYTVNWFDKRLNPADQNFEEIFGFILNIPTAISVAFVNLWNGKHWVALRKINGTWYNLDSKLPEPRAIGTDLDVRKFLQDVLQKDGTNLFVVKPETSGERINEPSS
jgi:josephin